MFTKNWYKANSAYMFDHSQRVIYTGMDGVANRTIYPYSNQILLGGDYEGNRYPSVHKMRKNYTSNGGVIIGTGTTPPTLDDYDLSGMLITDYTYSVSVSREFDENGATMTALYTITNTGTQAFTIGEIGLMADLDYNGYSKSSKALLEHTVLDTPLTIAPGGVGQLTYTIRFNYPTA